MCCCSQLLSPQKWSPPRPLICSDTAVLTCAPLWGRNTAFLCLALNPARLWCVAMRHCSCFASLPALCKHIRATSNDGLIKEQFSCNLSPGAVYSGSSSQLCQRCTCSLHHAKAAPRNDRPWPCFRISFQHHIPFLGAPKLNMRSPKSPGNNVGSQTPFPLAAAQLRTSLGRKGGYLWVPVQPCHEVLAKN